MSMSRAKAMALVVMPLSFLLRWALLLRERVFELLYPLDAGPEAHRTRVAR